MLQSTAHYGAEGMKTARVIVFQDVWHVSVHPQLFVPVGTAARIVLLVVSCEIASGCIGVCMFGRLLRRCCAGYFDDLPRTVQVNVAGKGFAASQSGQPYYVSASLAAPIVSSPRGSPGGGWFLQFNSSSDQLGKSATSVYLRFRSEFTGNLADVYMLPDPKGNTDRLHALICASTVNSSTLPVLPFLGLQAVQNDNEDDSSLSDGGEDSESGPAGSSGNTTDTQGVTRARVPWQIIAEEFNITGLPSGCRYYTGRGLNWSLSESQLVMPAPPQAVFEALHAAANESYSSSGSGQAADRNTTVTVDLFLNSQNVSSSQVDYAFTGPSITSVVPPTISAASSQVIHHSSVALVCHPFPVFLVFQAFCLMSSNSCHEIFSGVTHMVLCRSLQSMDTDSLTTSTTHKSFSQIVSATCEASTPQRLSAGHVAAALLMRFPSRSELLASLPPAMSL